MNGTALRTIKSKLKTNKPKPYTTVLIVCVPRDSRPTVTPHLDSSQPPHPGTHTEHDYHSVSQLGLVTSLLVTPLPRVLPASLHPITCAAKRLPALQGQLNSRTPSWNLGSCLTFADSSSCDCEQEGDEVSLSSYQGSCW